MKLYLPFFKSVGFDQIADMFDRVLTSDTQTSSYPPYIIEKIDEDAYRISVAVAGFSEVDTFRSNQIREGMISRETALKLVYKENEPMYNSIKWYLDTIGLDYSRTIKTINKIDKLY